MLDYTVNAGNGIYKPVSGAFYATDPTKIYSIKTGNWNDPTTWSTNAVPGNSSKVYVTHTVTVTANAAAKTVTVYRPGNVVVNAGRLLNILN